MPPIARMVRYFGSRQIKNRATVGGNLCNASPIGDLAPVLIALGAEAVLWSQGGERRLPLEQFFLGYRKTALTPAELLAGVELPILSEAARACSYKVSKRRELDISTVAAAFKVEVDGTGIVTDVRLAFGGMAATPARASRAEALLRAQPWGQEAVEAGARGLEEDFRPVSDHRGSAAYRLRVAQNLLRGFFEESRDQRLPGLRPGHTATVQVP
jgi:xanthine dehydrogenase iron-sulfur cluster and FAD-binding subunit A